jgi:pre-rRNA-processing protein TSR4
MVLLLQLNGELPDFPGHERRLYILTCRRKTCRRKEGSVRVLRGVRITEPTSKDKRKETETKPKQETKAQNPAVNMGEVLFGAKPSNSSSANPFSTIASSPINSNPFSTPSKAPNSLFATAGVPSSELRAQSPQKSTSDLPKTFASALSLNSPPQFGPPPIPEPWPQDSELPPAYPLYYLDPDYEELDKKEEVAVPTQTMDLDEGGGSGGGKEEKEVFESEIDRAFQKFADRLAQNPEQVLRYEFMGSPLLYSKKDAVGKLLGASRGNEKVQVQSRSGSRIPKCTNCGAGRVFEVQLTPHAIMELEKEEEGLDGMEWGTVIVGVCEGDCQVRGVNAGGVGYLEEWVGVQWEELGARR